MAAPDPATQERVYRAIRYDLGAGHLRPGERLEAMRLAQLYGSSITPVREALYRLVGEQCVDLHAGGGFSVAMLNRDSVSALYDANKRLILSCLRPGSLPAEHAERPRLFSTNKVQEDYPDRTADMFISLAEWSGNAACVSLVRHVNARLLPVRRAEFAVFGDAIDDLTLMETLPQAGSRSTLVKAVQRYHDRRIKAAPLICAELLG